MIAYTCDYSGRDGNRTYYINKNRKYYETIKLEKVQALFILKIIYINRLLMWYNYLTQLVVPSCRIPFNFVLNFSEFQELKSLDF